MQNSPVRKVHFLLFSCPCLDVMEHQETEELVLVSVAYEN